MSTLRGKAMDIMLETLRTGLPALGLQLEENQMQTLCTFGRAVVEENRVMNLTAITQPEDVARLHLLDSLSVLTLGDFSEKTLIDVGCGAGFPGVPLAVACPELRVTLLDSLGKRMNWLEGVLPTLGISAECVTARAEECPQLRETYDIAVSRAVARLNILLELTAPLVKPGGLVIAMKGSAAREELEEAASAIPKLGLRFASLHDFPTEGGNHTLLVFQKQTPTPARYPRRYAKIKQSPL